MDVIVVTNLMIIITFLYLSLSPYFTGQETQGTDGMMRYSKYTRPTLQAAKRLTFSVLVIWGLCWLMSTSQIPVPDRTFQILIWFSFVCIMLWAAALGTLAQDRGRGKV